MIDPEEFYNLYDMFEDIKFRKRSSRKGFDNAQSIVFGMRKNRRQEVGLSTNTMKYPWIWNELQRIGELFPCKYTSVYVNKNVECDWHLDKGNVGDVWIVSFGDYQGCNLEIEGYGEVNTNCNVVRFDGSVLKHRTTPLISGTKYSLVFYCHSCMYK